MKLHAIALGLAVGVSAHAASYYDASTGITYTSGTGYASPSQATRTLQTPRGAATVTANTRGAAVQLHASTSTQPATVVMTLMGPILELSSSTVGFGTVQAGQTSAVQTVTLTNAGDVPLVFSGMSFPVASPEFSASSTCGANLAPGTSCQVSFQFSPQTAGNRSISYEVKTTSTRTPLKTVALTGNGLLYTYAWHVSGWSTCSATCGIGTQSRSVWCQRNDGTTSADANCMGSRPPTSQSCPRYLC